MTTFQDNKTFSEFVQSIPFEPLVYIEERKQTVMSAALQVMRTEFEPSDLAGAVGLRPWFDNNSAYWWVSDVDGNDNDHWIGNIAFDVNDVVHCYTPMFKSWAEFGKINQGTYEPEFTISETRRGLERPSLEGMADEIQGERDDPDFVPVRVTEDALRDLFERVGDMVPTLRRQAEVRGTAPIWAAVEELTTAAAYLGNAAVSMGRDAEIIVGGPDVDRDVSDDRSLTERATIIRQIIQGERDLDELEREFDLQLPEPPTWNAQQVLKFLSNYLFASVGVDEWDSAKDSDQWYDEIVVFVGDMLEMDLAAVHASIDTDQAWIKRQNELRHNTISDLMTQHEDEMKEMAGQFIQMAHNTAALKPLNLAYQAMQRRHFNEMAEIIEPTVL